VAIVSPGHELKLTILYFTGNIYMFQPLFFQNPPPVLPLPGQQRAFGQGGGDVETQYFASLPAPKLKIKK